MVNDSMHRLFSRLRGESSTKASYPVVSKSGRIRLDPIQKFEVGLVAEWFSNHESSRLAFGVDADPEILGQLTEEYIDELHKDQTGVLMIRPAEEAETARPMGFVRYKIYRKGRRSLARVGILVADARTRGQGLGSEAMSALLGYLFAARRVSVVELDTADFNVPAQRCFLRCGFELLRETEVIDIHNRWTERRHVMRLEKAQWKGEPTFRPQS